MESVPSVVTNSPSSYLIDAFSHLSKEHENIHGVHHRVHCPHTRPEYRPDAPRHMGGNVLVGAGRSSEGSWRVQFQLRTNSTTAPTGALAAASSACMSSSLRPNLSRVVHAKRIPTVQSISLRTCLTRLAICSGETHGARGRIWRRKGPCNQ